MARSNAIQQDVLDEETDTGIEATPNPRQDRIEQLADENHKRMLEELGTETTEDDTQNDQANNQPANNQTTNDPQLLGEDDLMKMRVKTKVDGIEEEHSIADVVKSYQKDSAASKRLEEVARRQADLEAREQALLAREAALTTNSTNQDHPSVSDDAVKNVVSSLYEGDEDKTIEAFNQLLAQRSPAIANQTDASQIALQVRQQIATEQAMADFGDSFPDIVADPFLAQLADTHLAKALQDGNELTVALTKAGNSTREWLQQKGVPTVSNKTDNKLQRKQNLDNLPEAKAKQLSQDNSQDDESNASAIIAGMRKARGLPA